MKITFDLPPDVMRDITAALANAIVQAQNAAERAPQVPGTGSWPTAEDDLIALDVLHRTLHEVMYESEVG